ncbi:MAG TPA: FG-GAP-like repeat-containing protein [Chloroflexia bacterium]|nr:FG-GAP-like repeat-containing protein [Chloroflexia bacterium]
MAGPHQAMARAARPDMAAAAAPAGGCATAGFGAPTAFAVGQPPAFVATADFNHDDVLDLVSATTSDSNPGVAVLRGDGVGGFGPALHYSTGEGPRALVVGDFNHDTNLDVATADSSDFPANVSVLLGDGLGGFGPALRLTAGTTAWAIASGDFNHDTNLDLVVANFNSANISVFLGNGAGGFSAASTMAVGIRPADVVVGDFSGDSHLDVAVADSDGGVVWVLLGTGSGTFGPPTSFAAGTNIHALTPGDVDQDGALDLVTANSFSYTLSVLMGQGDGGFSAPVSIPVPGFPNSVAVRDLTGDGDPDLAVTANAPDGLLVLIGDGAGGFGPPTSFPAGPAPWSLALGDYNRDGSLDVATTNVDTWNVAVLLNQCVPPATDTPTATATATAPPPSTATATAPPPSTATATATATVAEATATRTPAVLTATPAATVTATPCAAAFSDVQPIDYFYTPVRYLACHGVVSGYADGTFRPYQNTTRAQMVKIVVLGFGLPTVAPPPGSYTFADVPPAYPFFSVIETAAASSIVSGYACGGPGEPCDAQRRAYFRPGADVTRGQLAKIDTVAAGWPLRIPGSPTFTDVAPGSAFYGFVETAVCHGVISGYSDHTFRPGAGATRGQIAKIVYLSVTAESGACSGSAGGTR